MINNSINLNYYSTGAVRKPFFGIQEVHDHNFYVPVGEGSHTNIKRIFGHEQDDEKVKSVLIEGVDFLNDQYKKEGISNDKRKEKISTIRANAESLRGSWTDIYKLEEALKIDSPNTIYADNQAQKISEDSIENQEKVLIKGNLLILIFDLADDFTKKKLFEILSISDEAFDNTLNSIVDKMEQVDFDSYVYNLKKNKQHITLEELQKIAGQEVEDGKRINLSELTEIVVRESNLHKYNRRSTDKSIEGESVFVDPYMFLGGKRIQ